MKLKTKIIDRVYKEQKQKFIILLQKRRSPGRRNLLLVVDRPLARCNKRQKLSLIAISAQTEI